MIITGLKNINQHIADDEARHEARKNNAAQRVEWFKLQPNKSVKVAFLNELDEDAPGASEANGLAVLAVEHANPKNFRRKALCTSGEDGDACYGCEQHRQDYKAGWGQKRKLYINVLVDDGTNEPYVALLSQGFGPKSITPNLIEFATLVGGITDKWFSMKRTGKELSDTAYTLTPLVDHGLNVEDYEVYDLMKIVREVPYAEQEAFYTYGESKEDAPAPSTTPKVTVSTDLESAEW